MPETKQKLALEGIRALWIDVDNTLLDFRKCADECSEKCFQDWNLRWDPSYSEVFHRLNNGLWKRIERKELDLDGLKQIRWNLILHEIGIEDVDGVEFEVRFRHYLNSSHVPVNGALKALQILQKRYWLFVISNGPSWQQINRLSKAGMEGYFRGIFTSEELKVSKPDVRFFQRALAMTQKTVPDLKKEEILVIGDSLSADIQGALNAGFRAVWFDLDPLEKTEEESPVPVFHTWKELTDILMENQGTKEDFRE